MSTLDCLAPATAQPVPCSAASNSTQIAAVKAAEAWLATRWQRDAAGWTTAYVLKPAAPVPLGIGAFGLSGATGAELRAQVEASTAKPITGLATVTALSCSTYELNSGHPTAPSYAIRFSARSLRFNEESGGWTRPLPAAVLHVLEVQSPPDASHPPRMADLPEARTALPPDMQLSLPAPASALPTAAAKRR